MTELKQKIYDLLKVPQVSGFATITEEGRPWVRYVVTVADEDLNIRFATCADSRKVAQLAANPNIHLTAGCTSLTEISPYMQIEGTAEFTQDEKERHDFWDDGLAAYFDGPDAPNYGVVIICPTRIELIAPPAMQPVIWTADEN